MLAYTMYNVLVKYSYVPTNLGVNGHGVYVNLPIVDDEALVAKFHSSWVYSRG